MKIPHRQAVGVLYFLARRVSIYSEHSVVIRLIRNKTGQYSDFIRGERTILDLADDLFLLHKLHAF